MQITVSTNRKRTEQALKPSTFHDLEHDVIQVTFTEEVRFDVI